MKPFEVLNKKTLDLVYGTWGLLYTWTWNIGLHSPEKDQLYFDNQRMKTGEKVRQHRLHQESVLNVINWESRFSVIWSNSSKISVIWSFRLYSNYRIL